jgi:hypothetical protein
MVREVNRNSPGGLRAMSSQTFLVSLSLHHLFPFLIGGEERETLKNASDEDRDIT